jgi:hypothetical protein
MISDWVNEEKRSQDKNVVENYQYLWHTGQLEFDNEVLVKLRKWSLTIIKSWKLPLDRGDDLYQDLAAIIARCNFRGKCTLQYYVTVVGNRLVTTEWRKKGANAVLDLDLDGLQTLTERLEDGHASALLEEALRRISSRKFVGQLSLICNDFQCEILKEIELSQQNNISVRDITKGLKKRRPGLNATRYRVGTEYERILNTVRRIMDPRNGTC